jgi:hypothetical protein
MICPNCEKKMKTIRTTGGERTTRQVHCQTCNITKETIEIFNKDYQEEIDRLKLEICELKHENQGKDAELDNIAYYINNVANAQAKLNAFKDKQFHRIDTR